MDCLTDKQGKTYNYNSRYNPFYFYYNKNDDKYMYGLTSQLSTSTEYLIHTVVDNDSFDTLALKYYGRPDLFWVIADFNRIRDPYTVLYNRYKTIKIPTITTIKYE